MRRPSFLFLVWVVVLVVVVVVVGGGGGGGFVEISVY